jgi:hypothetical protein
MALSSRSAKNWLTRKELVDPIDDDVEAFVLRWDAVFHSSPFSQILAHFGQWSGGFGGLRICDASPENFELRLDVCQASLNVLPFRVGERARLKNLVIMPDHLVMGSMR